MIDNKKNLPYDITSLLEIVTSGCDERLFLNPTTGKNKYHLDPIKYKNVLHRGSCTAGTLTPFTWDIAQSALERIYRSNDEIAWSEEQRERLKTLIAGQDKLNFDIFFGPSGSDLVYYPLLFQYIYSKRPILNIVSCPEELGSGSILAAEGRYHSDSGPFGSKLNKGSFLSESLKPKTLKLSARNSDGKIRNRKKEIKKIIKEHPNHSCIVNLVYGSKSGIEDDLEIIDPNLDVLWTVDLCQFRADPILIKNLLSKGAMVLITGSKFYNAPPFCGALLTPEIWTKRIKQCGGEKFQCVKEIFTTSDIPKSLSNLSNFLSHSSNKGSRLRWDCALAEMEAYNNVPKEQSNKIIQSWNKKIVAMIDKSDFFELMPDQKLTNSSIVSFRVIRDLSYFSHSELKLLFTSFVNKHFSSNERFERIFIGQPVKYGNSSFIRFALGSWAIRELLKKKTIDWLEDEAMVHALENETIQFERYY